MTAYELVSFGAPLERAERPVPEPQGEDVLLRVTSCGVCHSDVHLRDGYYDLGGGKKLPMPRGVATFPHVLGHEIVGEVVALGPDASGVEVGTRYIAYPWIGDGTCPSCVRGDEQLCTRPRSLGISALGGYAQYVVVPHARYLVELGALHEQFACTLACAGLTAYASLKKALPLAPEDRLVIFGAGGVGLTAIALCERVTGVRPVVVEPNAARREAALAAGAAAVVDPNEVSDSRDFGKRCGGRLNAAIDFVGSGTTMTYAFENLTMGGRVVSVGLLGGAFELPLPMLALRNISLIGTYVGTVADLRELVALVKASPLPAMPIDERPLDAADAALADLAGGRVTGRVVLRA